MGLQEPPKKPFTAATQTNNADQQSNAVHTGERHTPGELGGQAGRPSESRDPQHPVIEHNHIALTLAGVGSWCETAMPLRAEWEDGAALIAPASAPHCPSASPLPFSCGGKPRSAYVSDEPPLQDDDASDEISLIRQPKIRPISSEQLVAEVKGIYAGLVMVENKCIEVDNKQNAQVNTRLRDEEWQALIALHRTLLHEHYDFFLGPQHPSASPALRRLASKYRGLPTPSGYISRTFTSETLASLAWMSHRIWQLVEGADGELRKWLYMTADIINRLFKRFGRGYFQTLVYVLLFYRFFTEFPSGIRHLCTTMPWTIWPALVVLWGVCWMFIQKETGAREDTSLLPYQPQQEQDVNTDVDFIAELFQLCNNPSHDFPSSNLAVSHPTFRDLEDPPPPIHSGFTAPYQSSVSLTTMSNEDIFPTLLTRPYVDPASLATNSSYPVSPAAYPEVGPSHTPAKQSLDWAFQHRTPATAPSMTSGTHHTSQPNQAIVQWVPNLNTSAKAGTLPAKSASFRCPDCGGQFDRKDIFSRHMLEQKHGEFTGSNRPEYRCPNPQCRKSVEDNGFKRYGKLQEHLRKNSCKPNRRLSKARQRLTSKAPPTTFLAPLARPLDMNYGGANETLPNEVAPDEFPVISHDDASEISSDEASSSESALAAPISAQTEAPSQPEERASTLHPQKETTSVGKFDSGKPTLAERIAFHERCCEADEEELNMVDEEIRTMEEALRAKQEDRQRTKERIVASRRNLEMLRRQQQGHGTNA